MSNGKTKEQKKRKRRSSLLKSQIGIRLEKLRGRRRDLWGDDDDDDDDNKNNKQLKITKNNNHKLYIVLSDSDEEKSSSSPSPSKQRSQNIKSRKKLSQNHVKNATCLICSILSQLSSYNCCSEHLSTLKNQQQATTTITNSQFLPEKVMILPLTDEIVQRYLDPQQIHHLRTSTSSINKNILTTKKSFNKSTMTSDLSESEQLAKPLASTIIIESARSNSVTIPPDITSSTVGSSTSIINNAETATIIDIDQSSIQKIPMDDIQQEHTLIKSNNKQIDPWIPISDEIDAALEQALDQIDSSFDTPLEFTPATVRRTETQFMAAHLPKIPLKEGRFRQGKPIIDRTTSNAANEYRPLAASQSPPVTSPIITTNIRSPPVTINVEKESNQSEHIINNHNDNILTQDEIDPLPTIIRTNNIEIEINQSNEIQHVSSSTTTNKTTPSRISFRMNPDGTRVSISRPPLPTNHQSPLVNALRRTSTDVTPIQPNTNQV